MINIKKINLNILWLILWLLVSFLLSWCWWNSWTWKVGFSENVYWYDLNYNGKTNLERVWLRNDDLEEIVDLFQEVWDDVWYRDSLLVAEKHAQWLWVNAFAQDNLDTLQEQWLTLLNIQKTQVWLKSKGKKVNGVLVEFEITQWLVSEIPLLYVSELFIPRGDDILLMSFITESHVSHLSALDMFKNIE